MSLPRTTFFTSLALILASICHSLLATTYYVSVSGNDANLGTSSNAPLQSITKVNTLDLNAGDKVLFKGGETFTGGINLDASDAGTPTSPVTINSYGAGRATISSGTASGLYAYNCAGLNIYNLIFVGAGAATNTTDGISLYCDLTNNVKLPFVRIHYCDVNGYVSGVVVGSWLGTCGYSDVRVTTCNLHDNRDCGLITYSQGNYGLTNLYIGDCKAYNNLGDPVATGNSGSGIIASGVDGATVERCLAYNNGQLCKAKEGGVGIWCYQANNVTMQFNESYNNKTGGPADGGGFDLDGGTKNSVVQYNYSHNNDGGGYELCQYSGAPTVWANNTVRYNISQNDSRKNGYGAINLWNGTGSANNMTNCNIYNNVVYLSPATNGSPEVVRFQSPTKDIRFRNNIFCTTGSVAEISVPAGQVGLLFQKNDYWSYSSPLKFTWCGTNYTSVSSWQAVSGQENYNGSNTALNSNPLLVNPGNGGTINNPTNLVSLSAYKLQTGSPMINAGFDLQTLFGIDPGTRDFYGNAIPQNAFDLGAQENP